eukprot:gene29140-35170_t
MCQQADVFSNDDKSGNGATKQSMATPIRIATIDNYQGEESKIVLVSLVRSNEKREIGFVSMAERVNIIMSRARDGLVIIGNVGFGPTSCEYSRNKRISTPLRLTAVAACHVTLPFQRALTATHAAFAAIQCLRSCLIQLNRYQESRCIDSDKEVIVALAHLILPVGQAEAGVEGVDVQRKDRDRAARGCEGRKSCVLSHILAAC